MTGHMFLPQHIKNTPLGSIKRINILFTENLLENPVSKYEVDPLELPYLFVLDEKNGISTDYLAGYPVFQQRLSNYNTKKQQQMPINDVSYLPRLKLRFRIAISINKNE